MILSFNALVQVAGSLIIIILESTSDKVYNSTNQCNHYNQWHRGTKHGDDMMVKLQCKVLHVGVRVGV